MAPPHSATVRGTLSNSSYTNSNIALPLGDPISLEHEKTDSTPQKDVAPADPYRQNESKVPHSQLVRGTLANSKGPEVNKSMLGDPVSLKAETSKSEWGRGAGKNDDDMRKAAEKRVGSKL